MLMAVNMATISSVVKQIFRRNTYLPILVMVTVFTETLWKFCLLFFLKYTMLIIIIFFALVLLQCGCIYFLMSHSLGYNKRCYSNVSLLPISIK